MLKGLQWLFSTEVTFAPFQIGIYCPLSQLSALGRHVPADHLLRSMDRFVNLDGLRRELYLPSTARSGVPRSPSTDDPNAVGRLLLRDPLGAALMRRGSFNLAYRWFCRLGLDGDVPDIEFVKSEIEHMRGQVSRSEEGNPSTPKSRCCHGLSRSAARKKPKSA